MAKAVHTRIPAAPTPPPTPAAPAHVPAPVVTPVNPTRGVPTVLVVLFVLLFIAFGIWAINALSPKSEKTTNSDDGINVENPQKWETHSLRSKGDSVIIRIPYGSHIHTFSVHNKLYGCHYQGGTRQVIGNGVKYNPNPINSRYVYLYYENDIEDIDCLIVKNGKCPYDNY